MIRIYSNKKERDIVNFWNHMVFHPTNAIEDEWGKMQLDKLAEERAIQIVRIYSMFEEIVTLDDSGNMQYDFTLNDQRIDYLLSKGFTPYLAYGFFPGFLSAEQDENLISKRYKGNLLYRSYIKDISKWEEICRVYTQHIVDRYGEDTVAKWYIHCYNEPDLQYFYYWNAGDDYEKRAEAYCQMYAGFVNGITSVSKKLKIGGVALAQSKYHYEFLEYFLNYVKAHDLRLDFISYHSYGTSPYGMLDDSRPLHVRGAVMNTMTVKHIAKMCGFGHVETVCDEWGAAAEGYLGTETCAQLDFRENEVYAAYYAKMLTHFDEIGLHDMQLICMSGAHDLKVDFGGHRNFFSKNFYPKPIYNAYVLAAKLGSEKLYQYTDQSDDNVSVMPTRHADGHISVLMAYAEDSFKRRLKPCELDVVFPDADKTYKVTGWRIDADHANAIRKFKELGMPADPTEEQKQAIREFGSLKPEDLGIVSADQKTLKLHMEDNTTILLELVPVN